MTVVTYMVDRIQLILVLLLLFAECGDIYVMTFIILSSGRRFLRVHIYVDVVVFYLLAVTIVVEQYEVIIIPITSLITIGYRHKSKSNSDQRVRGAIICWILGSISCGVARKWQWDDVVDGC